MQSHYKQIILSKCEFSSGFAFCEAQQTFVFNNSVSKVIENKTELMCSGLSFCFFPNTRGMQTVHLEDLTHPVSLYSTPVCKHVNRCDLGGSICFHQVFYIKIHFWSRDKNTLFSFTRQCHQNAWCDCNNGRSSFEYSARVHMSVCLSVCLSASPAWFDANVCLKTCQCTRGQWVIVIACLTYSIWRCSTSRGTIMWANTNVAWRARKSMMVEDIHSGDHVKVLTHEYTLFQVPIMPCANYAQNFRRILSPNCHFPWQQYANLCF